MGSQLIAKYVHYLKWSMIRIENMMPSLSECETGRNVRYDV